MRANDGAGSRSRGEDVATMKCRGDCDRAGRLQHGSRRYKAAGIEPLSADIIMRPTNSFR